MGGIVTRAYLAAHRPRQLGTNPKSLPNRLPAPDFELGVIEGENGGTVSVERTKLPGRADFIALSASHTFIVRSEEAMAQALHFLRHGAFAPLAQAE